MPEASDIARARERIRHASRVWEGKGLLKRQQNEQSLLRWGLEMYRGNHWRGTGFGAWAGLSEHELQITNKVFSSANAIDADLTARNPKLRAVATSPHFAPHRSVATILYNYDFREQRMMRQMRRALNDHFFAPFGAVRHGFTPEEEFETEETERKRARKLEMYRPARPNRPWIRRIPIWDVRIDPLAESFHPDGGATWCAFHSLFRPDQLRRNPNLTLPKGLEPNAAHVLRDERPASLRDKDNPELTDMYSLWTIYDAVEETWGVLSLDGPEKWIRPLADWPIPWSHLPVNVFSVNDQMDTPFALSLMEEALPVQIELDKLRTIMSQIARRTRRLIGYNKSQMDEDDETALTNNEDVMEFIATNGPPANVIQQIVAGTFPSELLSYHALLEEDIRELLGQSKMGRAQRINVETAAEANEVALGQNKIMGRTAVHFTQFIEDALRLYEEGRRFTTALDPGPETVPLLGLEDVAMLEREYLTVDPEVLQGRYDLSIEVDTSLSQNPRAEAQAALADLQVAMSKPDLFRVAEMARRYLETRGIDPRRGLQPAQVALLAQAVDAVARIRDTAGEEPDTPRAFTPPLPEALQ